MSNQSFTRRLEHLERLINNAASLIEQYEEILLVESDPRGRRKCITNIEQLRDQVTGYRNEYDRLRKNATATDSSSLSKRIEAKLDELLEGQDKIKAGVDALLPYYEMGQRAIIAELAKHFNQSEFADTRKILSAIETNLLAESTLRQLIDSAQLALAQLRDQGEALPQRDKIEAELADASLDIKHKVKLTIPLIPILLRYEGEIEVANLRQQWSALKNRVGRNGAHKAENSKGSPSATNDIATQNLSPDSGEREIRLVSKGSRKLFILSMAGLAVLIAGCLYLYLKPQNAPKPMDSGSAASPSPTIKELSTVTVSSPPKDTPALRPSVQQPTPTPAMTPPPPIVWAPLSVAQIRECVHNKYPGESLVDVRIEGPAECRGPICKQRVVVVRKYGSGDQRASPTEIVTCRRDLKAKAHE